MAFKPKIKSPSKKSSFQYKARSAEQVKERASKQLGGRDGFLETGVQTFKPRAGDNSVRILPPPPDADWGHYGLNLVAHYGVGPDQGAFLCLNKMKDEPCPICEEREEASSSGEEELADSLKPSYRVGVYVIDRNQEGKGPLLWVLSAGMDKDIIKLTIHPKTGEVLPIDDPDNGYDLNFNREGEGLKTKYKGIQFDRASSPLSDDPEAAEKWLNFIVEHPIDGLLKYHEYDYIKKTLGGQPPAEKADDADEETKKPVKETKSKIQPRVKKEEPKEEEKEAEEEASYTWADLMEMDEDALAELGETNEVEFPEDGFDDVDALRAFIAEALGIEAEEEKKPEPKKENWKDKLKKMKK